MTLDPAVPHVSPSAVRMWDQRDPDKSKWIYYDHSSDPRPTRKEHGLVCLIFDHHSVSTLEQRLSVALEAARFAAGALEATAQGFREHHDFKVHQADYLEDAAQRLRSALGE